MRSRSQQAAWIAVLTSFWGAAVAIWVAAGQAQSENAPQGGILSVGGSVTEIVFALGQEDRLVARDTTSTHPAQAESLPDVGYMRALSPEGVLSVSPSMIIAEEGAGPPETMNVLRSAGIPIITVPFADSGADIAHKIRVVGAALGTEKAAGALAEDVKAKLATAQAQASASAGETPKRVLFVLSTQGGRILASGTGTSADAIIRLAGGVNASGCIRRLQTDDR